MILLVILFSVYLMFFLEEKFSEEPKVRPGHSGIYALAVMFMFAGACHFWRPQDYAEMAPLPEAFRMPAVYISGVLEILGGIGVLFPRYRIVAALALLVCAVGAIPASFYASMNRLGVGGHVYGPLYLVFRVPMQLFLIWWTFRFGLQPRDGGKKAASSPYQNGSKQTEVSP